VEMASIELASQLIPHAVLKLIEPFIPMKTYAGKADAYASCNI